MNKFYLKTLLLCLFAFVGITASAADFSVGGIYYNKLTSATVEVTAPKESYYSGDIIIPSKATYDGVTYEVTKIGDKAFYECYELTSVIMPNSLTEIGERAFYYCSSLVSIPIPSHVTSIGRMAFERCSSLTSVTLPEGMTSISEGLFIYCTALTSVSIPESVAKIGSNAFQDCI